MRHIERRKKNNPKIVLFPAVTTERSTLGLTALVWHNAIIAANTDAVCSTVIFLMKCTRVDIA